MTGYHQFHSKPNLIWKDIYGDNRLSINERYNSKDEFIDRVKEETKKLLEQNYIIQDDFDIVVEACEERYDVLISGKLKNEDK